MERQDFGEINVLDLRLQSGPDSQRSKATQLGPTFPKFVDDTLGEAIELRNEIQVRRVNSAALQDLNCDRGLKVCLLYLSKPGSRPDKETSRF